MGGQARVSRGKCVHRCQTYLCLWITEEAVEQADDLGAMSAGWRAQGRLAE